MAGMPIFGVAGHDGDVGHERQLEPSAEGEAGDLGDGDLRVAQERLVELEGPAVDEQATALARTAGLRGVVGLGGAVVGVAVSSDFELSPYQAYALFMSAPVLNTPPSPRSTTTLTSSSSASSSRYAPSWRLIGGS